MSRRELIRNIISRRNVERCGFWLGNPDAATWPILHRHFGTTTEEELRQKLGDDCRWICPQFYPDVYQDPLGRELFDSGLDRVKHQSPPLADCESPAEVEDFPWPKTEYLHFDSCLKDLENAGDVYRMSGFWTCYYHNLSDLFGMEEYFVKMYTHPEVVQAALRPTRRQTRRRIAHRQHPAPALRHRCLRISGIARRCGFPENRSRPARNHPLR